ncbi:oxidoreductase [Cellulosimicrobium funkei]|nr:oxidoreductase [Cellulosimicrobium funkei]
MSLAQFSIGALVLLPLLGAAVSALLPPSARRVLGPVAGVGVLVLTVPVARTVATGQVVEVALGGYGAPLGIMLRADGLSVLFLCLAGLVGLAVTCYAALVPKATGQRLTRHGHEDANPGYWPLWLGCWAGLNAVFVSGDLFNTYVGLELVALSAVGLVALGGRDAWAAALRYLFVSVLGSLLFLVGVGLIVSATGTLDIGQAARVIVDHPETHPAVVLALALLTVGLCLKVALVPLHRWLIPAHAGAPSAVSPVLSALVIKASLFVLLRCWMWLAAPGIFPAGAPGADGDPAALLPAQAIMVALAWLLGGLGALALVTGSVMALRQTRLKELIAYSTVAQAGYWFLFFPVAMGSLAHAMTDRGITTMPQDAVLAGALGGTLGLALGHGIAKAALFLAAGFLKDLYGTDEVSALRGSIRHHPTLIMAMGLAAVGLAGLPISLAFSGKWLLASSAVVSGHHWILVAVVAGTLLSVAYVLRILGPLLATGDDDETPPGPPEPQHAKPPWAAQLAPLALGTLTILAGFTGSWTAGVLEVGVPW